MPVTNAVYRRAVKAADEILNWAIKTYPLLKAMGLPKVLGTYATASAVFRESGYTWYEASGDASFVLRNTLKEKYPMIDFIRSHFLIRKMHSVVSYYAVKERFVEHLGNATYYLPTVEEIESVFTTLGRIPNLAPILILPSNDPTIRKILEVHLHGRPPEQA